MNQLPEALVYSTVIIVIAIVIVLFAGTPDLLDAIIKRVGDTSCLK